MVFHCFLLFYSSNPNFLVTFSAYWLSILSNFQRQTWKGHHGHPPSPSVMATEPPQSRRLVLGPGWGGVGWGGAGAELSWAEVVPCPGNGPSLKRYGICYKPIVDYRDGKFKAYFQELKKTLLQLRISWPWESLLPCPNRPLYKDTWPFKHEEPGQQDRLGQHYTTVCQSRYNS